MALAWLPESLSIEIREYISLKSINILIGEHGLVPPSLAIIPLFSINLKGLIRCFELKDPKHRGGAKDCSLTVLFKEANDPIFYKHINHFDEAFKTTIDKLIDLKDVNKAIITKELKVFQENIQHILKDLQESELLIHEEDSFPIIEAQGEEFQGYRYKVIVCGDPQVGKTSTILRFTDKAFRRTYIPTIGVNISEKQLRYDKNTMINFTIWDIAGQAKFQTMRRHFYKGAKGQILVFDLTRMDTFQNISKWYQDLETHLKTTVPGVILGNKCDLVDQRKISQEEISILSKELGIEYFETSALTGTNVDMAFRKLGELILDKNK